MGCPMVPLAALVGGGFLLSAVIPLLPCWSYFALGFLLFLVWFKLADADTPTLLADKIQGIDYEQVVDKVYWVTGASSGIGEELAKQLAAAGAKVVLSARRKDELERVAKTCEAAKHTPMVLPFDMLDYASHVTAHAAVVAKFGRIDFIVLNAGRTQRSLAEDTEIEVTKAIMELNVFSLINLAKVIMPTFLSQGSGTYFITSSVAGKIGAPVISSYNASKHALNGYFDALRMELADRNINVLVNCPGPIATAIEASAFSSKKGAAHTQQLEKLEAKMSVPRCAHLMLIQLSRGIYETWVSENPVLFFMYFNQYCPMVLRFLGVKIFGPARARAFRTGEDPFSAGVYLGTAGKNAEKKKSK